MYIGRNAPKADAGVERQIDCLPAEDLVHRSHRTGFRRKETVSGVPSDDVPPYRWTGRGGLDG